MGCYLQQTHLHYVLVTTTMEGEIQCNVHYYECWWIKYMLRNLWTEFYLERIEWHLPSITLCCYKEECRCFSSIHNILLFSANKLCRMSVSLSECECRYKECRVWFNLQSLPVLYRPSLVPLSPASTTIIAIVTIIIASGTAIISISTATTTTTVDIIIVFLSSLYMVD